MVVLLFSIGLIQAKAAAVHQTNSIEGWTVLVNEARGEEWEHFEMGCAEFLVATLTGEVRSGLLWSRYPTDPHTFRASRLIQRED